MDARKRFEIIIVGGGIAGASLAYFLTERGLNDILLLEREQQPGQHATGRSAGTLVELDPNPTIQELKVLGARFLRNPPAGFCNNPLLRRSGIMVLFRDSMLEIFPHALSRLERTGVRFEPLSSSQAVAHVPVLSLGDSDRAVVLPEDGRIDVHELLSSYLARARKAGVRFRAGLEVCGLSIERGRCSGVITSEGEISAHLVVDAAGAWAGTVSKLIAAAPITLQPRRRTLVTFRNPEGIDTRDWPFVISDANHLYFGPESGGVLLSPMDEEPFEPCDPMPDDLVIAQAFERLSALAPRLVPQSVQRKWSGLRTFAPDGVPVVGEDRRMPGFFWLAGQGGCGIETSPAVGSIAADLIVRGTTELFDAAALSPSRFL